MKTSIIRRLTLACLAWAVLATTGCDSTTGIGGTDVTFRGRVTDNSGFGKSLAEIEDADVQARNVDEEGEEETLEGEATTDAEGSYALSVEGTVEEGVIVAEKADFTSKTMFYVRNEDIVHVMPMTSESHAEADVFVEARRQDEADNTTMSNVAVFVTEEVAADVHSDARTAANVAASITAEAEARTEYVRDQSGEDQADEARENENTAFLQLQGDLNASSTAEADAEAIEAFEESLIDVYTDADVSLETQAQARAAGRAALLQFGDASFEMEQKAELLAALATAHAIEASFSDAEASSERMDALVQARTELVAEIRAAASRDDISNAKADYDAAVKAELAAEAEVETNTLETAIDALVAAKTALTTALIAAASGSAVAEAHVSFYASAETAAESALSGLTSETSLAATVLALLSVS